MIEFKPHWIPPINLAAYGVLVIILLVIVVYLGKRQSPSRLNPNACQLIDRTMLNSKTLVYVIEYQQQRFILADNQHALTLHPLKSELPHEH